MACLNVRIIQTQVSSEHRDVMEFSGSMQKVNTLTNAHFEIFLENNVPYLKICDIDENTIELYFMATKTKLVLKKDFLCDYIHNEQENKMNLKILLKEKNLSDTKITLVYEIHQEILLVENKLEIEVK